MATKRNKPYIAMTVDADVAAWIKSEAKAKRMTLSAFLNRMLAAEMEREKRSNKAA